MLRLVCFSRLNTECPQRGWKSCCHHISQARPSHPEDKESNLTVESIQRVPTGRHHPVEVEKVHTSACPLLPLLQGVVSGVQQNTGALQEGLVGQDTDRETSSLPDLVS